GGDVSFADQIKRIPVWAFHGAEDPVVPVKCSRLMIEILNKVGGNPRYTEYPGVGHNSWDRAYAEPELLSWLFSQKRSFRRSEDLLPHKSLHGVIGGYYPLLR